MEDKGGIEGEEILGIFPGWIERRRGVSIKRWTCRLAFTTRRLIVAEQKPFRAGTLLGEPLRKPYYNASRADARRRLQMKEVSAEGVLKANSANFDINYSDIAVVEMKSPLLEGPKDLSVFAVGDLSVPEYKLSIAVTNQYLGEVKDFLSMILREKFHFRQ